MLYRDYKRTCSGLNLIYIWFSQEQYRIFYGVLGCQKPSQKVQLFKEITRQVWNVGLSITKNVPIFTASGFIPHPDEITCLFVIPGLGPLKASEMFTGLRMLCRTIWVFQKDSKTHIPHILTNRTENNQLFKIKNKRNNNKNPRE